MKLKEVIDKIKKLRLSDLASIGWNGANAKENLAKIKACFNEQFESLGLEDKSKFELKNDGTKNITKCNVYYDGIVICSINYWGPIGEIATSYEDRRCVEIYGEYEIQEAVNRINNAQIKLDIIDLDQKIRRYTKQKKKLQAKLRTLPSELAEMKLYRGNGQEVIDGEAAGEEYTFLIKATNEEKAVKILYDKLDEFFYQFEYDGHLADGFIYGQSLPIARSRILNSKVWEDSPIEENLGDDIMQFIKSDEPGIIELDNRTENACLFDNIDSEVVV